MIQHERARQLLPLVISAYRNNEQLTYQIVGEKLGHGEVIHPKPIGGVCDLLDAAATLAKVPLLALYMVKNSKGHFNKKAFGKEEREKIIKRSREYSFSDADFGAIGNSLEDLIALGYGNTNAWKYVHEELGDDMWLSLTGIPYRTYSNDAVDDLGSDQPLRILSQTASYARDAKVRNKVRERAGGKCELCGEVGFMKADGERYVETHHIIALADDGEDRLSNVIALCPNHHREAHYGEHREELETKMKLIIDDLQ